MGGRSGKKGEDDVRGGGTKVTIMLVLLTDRDGEMGKGICVGEVLRIGDGNSFSGIEAPHKESRSLRRNSFTPGGLSCRSPPSREEGGKSSIMKTRSQRGKG